jgi:NADPH:quinone reductase-like Zn-dependent oxidoreductase
MCGARFLAYSRTNGAYAQYVVAKADFFIAVPDNWSFEDAA